MIDDDDGGILMGPFPFSFLKPGPTVSEHYGMKDESFSKLENMMLCDLIMSPNLSVTLDKHFKELDGDGRAKVFAFACALKKFHSMKQ